jgi:RimJ/RimL family protein N-acetyltransferase
MPQTLLEYRDLRTNRLLLRRPRQVDALGIFESFSTDPEVTRYLTWRPHRSLADAEAALAARLERLAKGIEYSWVIERLESRCLIGIVSAWLEGGAAELGFVLARPHWNQGLATEAVVAVRDWALAAPEVSRVWATCDLDNHASARVLSKADIPNRGIFERKIVRPNLGAEARPSSLFSAVRSMRVTAVICTWNRCELLRQTLESLRALDVPTGQEWELLVVNNGSSDATDEVISEYREHLPLRRLFEPELGASRARNTAARAATGDLILFTDDDVRVDPGWMRAYLEAADRWPDAGFFGGRIEPRYDPDVPRWAKRHEAELAGMLCLRDLGPVSRRLVAGEFPFGPNMAVRRNSLALASFDERVGRRGKEQTRGSERSLFLRLQQQGVTGVWVPQARVQHFVPRCRANLRYLWTYFHGGGRMDVRLTGIGVLPQRRAPRLPMMVLRALVSMCWRPSNWPSHCAAFAWSYGRLSELKESFAAASSSPKR